MMASLQGLSSHEGLTVKSDLGPGLERGEDGAALKASQLCLRLLDASGRDQLRRLLAFMAQAAAPHACRLHKQVASPTGPGP
ncbi:unnamed protein product [Boreogadus saida]